MPGPTVVRTIYLYLLSFIGLILLVIGCVGFLNMGLKTYVFTHADDERRFYEEFPPKPVRPLDARGPIARGEESPVTEEDSLTHSPQDRQRSAKDFATSRRHREAAENTSYILIGFPLYLYHWRLIRRESRSA